MKKGIKIGNVITDEMKAVIRNKDLTSQQVGDILRSVLYPSEFDATSDGMSKMLASSMVRGYLAITLTCAESRRKELDRLNKYYNNPKAKCPEWFKEYYETNISFLNDAIIMISNIIHSSNNVSGVITNISKRLDTPPLTLVPQETGKPRAKSTNIIEGSNNVSKHYCPPSITSYKYNTNTNTNTNDTDRDRDIPPKSPEGLQGVSSPDEPRQPTSALDDPAAALGLDAGAGGGQPLARPAQDEPDADDGTDAGGALPDVKSVASEIEGSYRYKVNRGKLRKCLRSVLKKNSAAEVVNGYRRWLEVWKADDFQWAPSRITDWLYDGRFTELPRRGNLRAAPTVDPDTVPDEAHFDLV